MKLFTECACFWFAIILHQRFKDSSIVYNPELVHFATKINGRVYDISGELSYPSDYVDWEDYRLNSLDSSLIVRDCILLKGGESI